MILIAGPGRCGTSATAQALLDMEPSLSPPGDPLPADEFNPGGYTGESLALNAFLLEHVHPHADPDPFGHWWEAVPPHLTDQLHATLDAAFDRVPGPMRLLKTPIALLSLPWMVHAGVEIEAVVMSVRPIPDVDASARRFNAATGEVDFDAPGRAIVGWGRVTYAATLFDLPLVVSRYDDLCDATSDWTIAMRRQLRPATGLRFDATPQRVHPEWRHRP